MTHAKAHQPVDMTAAQVWHGTLTDADLRKIVISNGQSTATYNGDFEYDYFGNVSGRLERYTEFRLGEPWFTLKELDLDASVVQSFVEAGDAISLVQLAMAGRDTLVGSYGNDTLFSGTGGDVIRGRGGSDSLFGHAGCEILSGGRGADRLFGQDGADTLMGGGRADFLSGGSGSDTLKGGGGKDVLFGDVGNDVMAGGGGRDVFGFDKRFGDDVITDFNSDLDTLDFSGLSKRQQNNMTIERDGGDVVIDVFRQSITLKDTNLHEVDIGDFIF